MKLSARKADQPASFGLPIHHSSNHSCRSDSLRLKALGNLLHPATPTEVFATYWEFAEKRQRIFYNRFHGMAPPWTDDPILARHRFTNVYRATDRVSQFLISNVQYAKNWQASDLFFRTILFKVFNKIETWRLLLGHFGEPQCATFSKHEYSTFLQCLLNSGVRIYSAAYIMPSGGPRSRFSRKHEMHIHLLHEMMNDRLHEKLAAAKTMSTAFALLRGYRTIGDFLAYQYVIDLNYSTLINFSENEFVVPGPGAQEGIRKCFSDLGGKDLSWVIKRVQEVQDKAFAVLDLTFPRLWGRPLHLIDCQNVFCEVAKYARVFHPDFNGPSGRTRIKQRFFPHAEPITYRFPPKWNLPVP